MSKTYIAHECQTLEEVNALALTDGQQNDSLVLSPSGELCYWSLSYATRNEPTIEGYWSYQDSYGGDSIRFPLSGKESVLVLVASEDPEKDRLKAALREVLEEIKAEEAQERLEAQRRHLALYQGALEDLGIRRAQL